MLVDFELIEKARTGDGGAFNQVVQAYRKRLWLRIREADRQAGGC